MAKIEIVLVQSKTPQIANNFFQPMHSTYFRLGNAAVCIFSDITQETGNVEVSSLPLSDRQRHRRYNPPPPPVPPPPCNRQCSVRQAYLWPCYDLQSLLQCWTDWQTALILVPLKPPRGLCGWHFTKHVYPLCFPQISKYQFSIFPDPEWFLWTIHVSTCVSTFSPLSSHRTKTYTLGLVGILNCFQQQVWKCERVLWWTGCIQALIFRLLG